MPEPTFDASGYPSEDTLEIIEQWDACDPQGCLEFVRQAWNDTGKVTVDAGRYVFVTGGWSGNEDLLGSLHQNYVIYSLCWQMSQRGGRHEFAVPENFRK